MQKPFHFCFSSPGEVLFRDEEDHIYYFNAYAQALFATGSKSMADCEMSNHCHHVILSERPARAAAILRISYTKYYNHKYFRSGPLGEKGGLSAGTERQCAVGCRTQLCPSATGPPRSLAQSFQLSVFLHQLLLQGRAGEKRDRPLYPRRHDRFIPATQSDHTSEVQNGIQWNVYKRIRDGTPFDRVAVRNVRDFLVLHDPPVFRTVARRATPKQCRSTAAGVGRYRRGFAGARS